ncbi:MAG TPA: hypothetical protein VF463_03910 [Sphingobium sp.]
MTEFPKIAMERIEGPLSLIVRLRSAIPADVDMGGLAGPFARFGAASIERRKAQQAEMRRKEQARGG